MEEINKIFEEDGIFTSSNAQFCKDHIDIAPRNIFGLIKELLEEIEDLKEKYNIMYDLITKK